MIAGWAANSKYTFIGAIRSTAQLLSYELVFSSIILILLLFSGSFSLTYIVECQQAVWNIFPLMPIALIFFISILAETNRTPYDLSEAESELVAGFMSEHSASVFVFFFLGEYSSLILMSAFFTVFFLGGHHSLDLYTLFIKPIYSKNIDSNFYSSNDTSFISFIGSYLSDVFKRIVNLFNIVYEPSNLLNNDVKGLYFNKYKLDDLCNLNYITPPPGGPWLIKYFNKPWTINLFKINGPWGAPGGGIEEKYIDKEFLLFLDSNNQVFKSLIYNNDQLDKLSKFNDFDSSQIDYFYFELDDINTFISTINLLLDKVQGSFIFGIKTIIVVFFFIWVRASFPRLRYDQLMSLCWKELLPLVFAYILFSICLLYTFDMLPFGTSF